MFTHLHVHTEYSLLDGMCRIPQLVGRARELGMRTFLPPEVADALRRGDILAVGDLEIRYGTADRSGRNTEERVAYLTPGAQGERAAWSIQSVSRSANVLLMALKTVVEDMDLAEIERGIADDLAFLDAVEKFKQAYA